MVDKQVRTPQEEYLRTHEHTHVEERTDLETSHPRNFFQATPEHTHIGTRIILENDEHRQLTLPNGVQIKFEHIIALAGDFYGIPDQPIIDPLNEEDPGRYQRFLAAFNTLARAPDDKIGELRKLIAITDKDIGSRKQDEITGGKWVFCIPIKQGRMVQLAKNNHDHFLPYAKSAYLTGHQMAMEKAREASKSDITEQKKLLHEAYSIDAFACHFLTDSFASGHIRTPRVELGKATTLRIDGHYLSKLMHDEDGNFGLRVTNTRGDKWVAYGDGMLLDERSKDNLKYVVEATQKSVDQVYDAYQEPTRVINTAEVTDIIPFVDDEERNNYPLFQVKSDGKLYRRSNVYDLQDTNTVADWWGPTSVLLRLLCKPYNSVI